MPSPVAPTLTTYCIITPYPPDHVSPLSSPFDNPLPRPYVYHHRLWPDNHIHRLYPLVTATMRNAHLSAVFIPAQNQNNMPCVVQLCAMDTKMQINTLPSRALQACLQHLHESRVLKRCGNTLFVIKLFIYYGRAWHLVIVTSAWT